MSVGVGKWVQILDLGLLSGKMIQQLNGQTQRLLGQQSLAAYTGLKVDIDRVRADNEARTDAPRKAGLIINTGGGRGDGGRCSARRRPLLLGAARRPLSCSLLPAASPAANLTKEVKDKMKEEALAK